MKIIISVFTYLIDEKTIDFLTLRFGTVVPWTCILKISVAIYFIQLVY